MEPGALPRRLAAIVAADVVGYSRLMGEDEEGTLARLRALRADIVDPAIAVFHGRIFKTTGDGLLAEFPSVVDAVQCAASVQFAMASRSSSDPPERRIVFRVGINLGDIIVEGDDIYGDGVNIAARLEGICEPGGVAISASAYDQVRDKINYRFVDGGKQSLKNIARPVHVYRLVIGGGANRATAKAAGQRPRTRHWLATIAIAAVALAAIGMFGMGDLEHSLRPLLATLLGRPVPGISSSRATIAVLPFRSQTGGKEHDYFVDGITADIINALGRFSGVTVIAHNAVREYRGREANRSEVSRELGVRYIVQGSVRQSEGRLRITIELSDVDRGVLLWSERYDGEGNDVFDIQDRIIRDIVGALAVKLTQLEQQRVFAKPAGSLEAYDLVLRARDLLNRAERKANREARSMLARAIELAPNYAEPHLAMAEAEYQRASLGWLEQMDEGVRQSEEYARQALAIDDPGAHARAHALLGRVHVFFQRYDLALAAAERAIEINVSDAVAYALRGAVLLWLGRIDESITSSETARRFDPRIGADTGYNLALAYYTAGRHREAVAVSESFLTRYPQYVFLHAVRAAALAELGHVAEAREAAERVRRLSPFFQVELFGTGFVKREHQAKAQEGLRKAGL